MATGPNGGPRARISYEASFDAPVQPSPVDMGEATRWLLRETLPEAVILTNGAGISLLAEQILQVRTEGEAARAAVWRYGLRPARRDRRQGAGKWHCRSAACVSPDLERSRRRLRDELGMKVGVDRLGAAFGPMTGIFDPTERHLGKRKARMVDGRHACLDAEAELLYGIGGT